MRILTDFDGVWTDQADEARFIQSWLARAVAPIIGATPEAALDDFDAFFEAAMKVPGEVGWAPDGRVTGFIDEDLLLSTGSVFYWLAQGGEHPRADLWRDSIQRAGHASIEQFASDQFGPAMMTFRDEHAHAVVKEAKSVVDRWLAAGHRIAFVSNSNSVKLAGMLGDAEIVAGERIEVIGGACKWLIGKDEPRPTVGGRHVYMDRPRYREILERFRPDMVIGDVASFDLALPAFMRSRGELGSDLRLVLRRNENSSKWALAEPASREAIRLVDEVVDSVNELP
ncbi:MAG: hypothetical protein AAGG01_00375 [Planctomycetota bacterium]